METLLSQIFGKFGVNYNQFQNESSVITKISFLLKFVSENNQLVQLEQLALLTKIRQLIS